jgi:hypothetical protein
VAVLVVVLGAVPLVSSLLERRDQVLTTNTRSRLSATTTAVRPGDRECANVRDDELLTLPKGATGVRLYVGYDGRTAPRLRVSLSGDGTTIAGTSPRSYRADGFVVVPLERELDRDLQRICVRNEGPVQVELARAVDASGNDRPILNGRVGDEREPDTAPRSTVRFDLIGRQDALAVSLLGGGLDHATAFKPDGVGPVVIGGGLVLVLLLGLSGLGLVLREPGDVDGPGAVASGPSGSSSGGGSALGGPDAAAGSTPAGTRYGDDGRGGW